MSTRIYLVETKLEKPPVHDIRLVRAGTRAQAERYVAQGIITARVATQDDLVAHLKDGVQTAGEAPAEDETETDE